MESVGSEEPTGTGDNPGREAESLVPPRLPRTYRSTDLIILLAVTVLVAGFSLYFIQGEYKRSMASWEARTANIADYRARIVAGWLAERRAGAEVVARYPSVLELFPLQGSENAPAANAKRLQGHVNAIFEVVAHGYGYEAVIVLNPQGRIITQSGVSPPLDAGSLEVRRTVARQGEFRIHLQGDDPAASLLVFMMPVIPAAGAAGPDHLVAAPRGVVALLVDPHRDLFPLLTSETAPTRTAETLLVRRAGNEAVFISPLRHAGPTQGALRRPLADPTFAAAVALEGRETFGEFTDYRGVRVFAATRRIPGTDWGLVWKIDRDEALADYRRTALLEAGIAALLLLVSAGILVSYRRRAQQALDQSEEKFRQLFNKANDAVFVFPLTQEGLPGNFTELNEVACQRLGYTREEFRTLSPQDLAPPELLSNIP